MKFINKGVARRGAEGAAAPRHVTAPPLGGGLWGSGGAACFLVNSKNHIRIIEKSVLKEIKFTNLFNLI